VIGNVRNLGYVSEKIEVAKVEKSDRMARQRQSIFDVKSATAAADNGAMAGTRQPIRSDFTAGACRPLANNRSASS